jgi:hypothetical protein
LPSFQSWLSISLLPLPSPVWPVLIARSVPSAPLQHDLLLFLLLFVPDPRRSPLLASRRSPLSSPLPASLPRPAICLSTRW